MTRELIKIDISNMSEPAFKTIFISIPAWIEESIEETIESFITEMKDLKVSHAKMKAGINKMQNQVDVMSTRMEEAEKQVRSIEDKITENNETESNRERKTLDHKCEFSNSTE